ncbi:MAG: hypothetical protein JWM44_2469 [Bacilli bacterium]|jgi:Zn finger protein HypA/HybF involved in hydrogenase expression|nr:hypothetical protein [Bacilli bacterium]
MESLKALVGCKKCNESSFVVDLKSGDIIRCPKCGDFDVSVIEDERNVKHE